MAGDVMDQLSVLGDVLEQESGLPLRPPSADPCVVPVEALHGIDDLTVDYLRQSGEAETPTESTSRSGLVAAVAATVLVVVGVIAVAGGDSDEFVTESSGIVEGAALTGDVGFEAVGAMTAGGPGLVAVGSSVNDAAVSTSVDGITWTRVPHDEAIFGNARMTGVVAAGPGLVAVGAAGPGGSENAAVWTSIDGRTWTRVPHDEAVFGGDSRQGMTSVTTGGPGLVAVGSDQSGNDEDAAVWTSVDGITWARAPDDETVFGGADRQQMASVTAAGPGVVAVGHDEGRAVVWVSEDGITWIRAPIDPSMSDQWSMNSVTAGGPGVVAVGHDGDFGRGDAGVWTSEDGITWTRAPLPAVSGEWSMNSVTAGGPGLVAVGSSYEYEENRTGAPVWISSDGITWTRIPYDDAALGGDTGPTIATVTAGGPGLVALGLDWSNSAAVWTSVDGITWTRVPRDSAG